MTIACVLKLGGHYTREWVHALKRGLAKHAPPHDFVCLTDDCGVSPVWRVPLKHPWPSWWSKLNLFAPGQFTGPTVYLDLDTLVVSDLSDLCSYTGDFAMLSDFYRPKVAQSGVMLWTPNRKTEAMYETFRDDAAAYMKQFRGDGEYLRSSYPGIGPQRIQEMFDGQVVSYKVHAREGPPDGARLVCGHGRPRFDDPKAGWAHTYWRG